MSSLIDTSSSLLQSPVHTARAEAGTRTPNRASAAKTRANTRGSRWGRIDMIAQRYATELNIVRAVRERGPPAGRAGLTAPVAATAGPLRQCSGHLRLDRTAGGPPGLPGSANHA